MNLKDFININKLRHEGKYHLLTMIYNKFSMSKKVRCLEFMIDKGRHETLKYLLGNLRAYKPLNELSGTHV